LNLVLVEPQFNLLFGALNAVRPVADIPSNVDGIVEADSTWSSGERVCGAEDLTTNLDNLTAFPDHGADWARGHV